jgi:hypothetical protein
LPGPYAGDHKEPKKVKWQMYIKENKKTKENKRNNKNLDKKRMK